MHAAQAVLFNSTAKNKFTICTLHQISRVHEASSREGERHARDLHYTSICCGAAKEEPARCCLLKSLQFPLILLVLLPLFLWLHWRLLSFHCCFIFTRFNLSTASRCVAGSWRSKQIFRHGARGSNVK